MTDDTELRNLVEEYMVALELGQNGKVSNLGSKICIQFVNLLDQELQERAEINDDSRQTLLLKVVNLLCQKLRERSDLAATYESVVEFVQLKDLVCLSKLVRAVPMANSRTVAGKDTSVALGIDFDYLTRILRQSIHLLKAINRNTIYRQTPDNSWLFKESLVRNDTIGFPIYTANLDKIFSSSRNDEDQLALSTLAAENNYEKSPLTSALQSDWFKHFMSKTLDRPYPFDRFTILIAIWIVGVECRHWSLEQLIAELVDQIAHEETNSCNEEELMQITQVGSFWLSYHKRHEANIKQMDMLSQQAAAAEDDDDRELSDDEEPDSMSSSSGSVSQLNFAVGNNASNEDDEGNGDTHQLRLGASPNADLMRLKLERTIDDELLYGVQCLVCGYKPNELLEPLNAGLGNSCTKCNNSPIERCSISFQPLELTSLHAMINRLRSNRMSQLKRLVIVSPNEWARKMISSAPVVSKWLPATKALKTMNSDGRRDDDMMATVGERVDISENFERLTVIRRPVRSGIGKGRHDSSAGSNEENEEDDEEPQSTTSSEEENSDAMHNTSYLASLESFMRTRSKQVSDYPHQSESLKMIKHVERAYECARAIEFPMCSSDLLLMDSKDSLVKVRLVISNGLSANGTIWSCSLRSTVSQLLLGCGRLFTSLELIRISGKGEHINEFMCPYCDCQLSKIGTLSEGFEL